MRNEPLSSRKFRWCRKTLSWHRFLTRYLLKCYNLISRDLRTLLVIPWF
jgi:hypothetical protein